MTATESSELIRLLLGRLPGERALAALRRRRLRTLVRHAYEQVPYYRRLLDDAGVPPGSIRDVEDLRRLPISSRDDLRAAGDGGYSRGFDRATAVAAHTSGSTGKPWQIHRTRTENRLRRALELRSLRRAGLRSGDVLVALGPAQPPASSLSRLGLYRTRHIAHGLPIDEQMARLRALRPTVLWIYPSILRTLVERAGALTSLCRPRMVIHAAEALDDALREHLRSEGFDDVRNFYGAVETGRIAWDCGAGRGLHFNADCHVLEIDHDQPDDDEGSVVITPLYVRSAPLIRYRLGDRLSFVDGPCPCGTSLPLVSAPRGREWERIRLPSGRLVPPWALSSRLQQLPGLWQYRVVQKRRDLIVVQLAGAPFPRATELESLRGDILRLLGENVSLVLENVERIEPLGAKARVYVSELDETR